MKELFLNQALVQSKERMNMKYSFQTQKKNCFYSSCVTECMIFEDYIYLLQAMLFHKRWMTPPSGSPDHVKQKFVFTKREDSDKGVERIGR